MAEPVEQRWSWLAAVVALGLPLALFWPLASGPMPVARDHLTHLQKAWVFWNEALAHGRLSTWDGSWFLGQPLGDLYPLTTDLWIAAVRVLTLGQLRWEDTYSLALVSALLFCSWSVYHLGRRLFGAWAGCLAAILFTLDPGAPFEAGLLFTVEWGVWGQPVSQALMLVALASWIDLLEAPSRRRGVWVALWSALAVLAHSITPVVMGVVVPLAFAARRWGREGAPWRELWASAGAFGLGALLTSFWLLPFLTRRDFVSNTGSTLGVDLGELSRWVLEGRVFGNGPPLWVHLGLVGLVAAVVSRRWALLWTGLSGLVLTLLASDTSAQVLSSVSEALSRIIYQRMLIPGKVFFFLSAAATVAWTVRSLASRARLGEGATRVGAAALLACAALPPAALIATQTVEAAAFIAQIEREGSAPWWGDFTRLRAWLLAQREAEPGFFRVGLLLPTHDHRLNALPFYTGIPIYKLGYTPCHLFRYAFEDRDRRMWGPASVRYMIAEAPTPQVGEVVADFGHFVVHRVSEYSPHRLQIRGTGRAQVRRWDNEGVEIAFSRVGPDARVLLHMAPFPRWEAELNGQIVPTHLARLWEPFGPEVLSTPAEDGLLTLRYVKRPVERVGEGATLLGMCLLIGIWLSPRR